MECWRTTCIKRSWDGLRRLLRFDNTKVKVLDLKVFLHSDHSNGNLIWVDDDATDDEGSGEMSSESPFARNVAVGHIRLVCMGRVMVNDRELLESYIPSEKVTTIHMLDMRAGGSGTAAPATPQSNEVNLLTDLVDSPMLQQLAASPEVFRGIFESNPHFKQLMENNPQLHHILSDSELLREQWRMMTDPRLRQEMMRTTDRAISNIEAMPGGFNHLRQMYETIQEPLWKATEEMSMAPRSTTFDQNLNSSDGPNSEALPNPWAPPRPSMSKIEQSFSSLKSMGLAFSDESLWMALTRAGGDVDRAVCLLMEDEAKTSEKPKEDFDDIYE